MRSMALLAACPFCLPLLATEPGARPEIIKTGTIDLDIVEAHNFVWKVQLRRENRCKAHCQGKRGLPGSHIAIKDAATGKLVASRAPDHAFGTVYVEGDTWGNQHGTEHLGTAEYRGTMASFLEGWFPAK